MPIADLPSALRLFADAVLLLHLGVVLFVVSGPLLILAGNALRWSWVNGLPFRLAHLAVVGFVVVQQWLGTSCPLTRLESWLRVQADQDGYARGFIAHGVQSLLFYDAPAWIFTLAYTAFAVVVAGAWLAFPPRSAHGLQGS